VFIYYTIYIELLFYIHVRYIYLTSPKYRRLKVINIILVTDIPKKDLPILKILYNIFPNRVRSV